MPKPFLDTSLHKRLQAEDMKDSEYRDAYLSVANEIAQTDSAIHWEQSERSTF